MSRIASLVVVALILAACGESTESGGGVPGVEAPVETDPAPAADDSNGDDTVPEPAISNPSPSDPARTEPTPTEPATTDSPTPDSTPATAPPSVPAPTDPPVTDPPPAVPTPTDRVVRFFAGNGEPGFPWAPLGAWDGGDWQPVRFVEGVIEELPPSPIETVAATSLDLPDGADAVISGLTLGPETTYCVGDETGPVIDLPVTVPRTDASLGFDVVAVTADWPLQPRPVRQVGLEVPEYATVGAALVADVAPAAPDGDVVQVVRADLDGDDVEEVLVTYERQEAGDFGGEGDFSSIYVRYPSPGGSVADQLLVEYVSAEPADFPTPGRHTLAAVADLNGDGVMEVVVRDSFWESGSMQVFALEDGRLTRVSSGGCGV